ncbi:hypothetical protein NP233_g8769 [Leucocoprinus birnbaumii]|uniref:HNH nuclease domain-containing protein n=1 Tax=Leucocoprinus birnbaumii TaxID=56174 RepID=A0AAD5VLT7_9AGAR|nr:hypothetical protein NP233_g8769 [Leucocoprinus birnbaumii]
MKTSWSPEDLDPYTDRRLAHLLVRVLDRDNHNCVLIGFIDGDSRRAHADLTKEKGAGVDCTHTTHIITKSLSDNINGTSDLARTAGAILEPFRGFHPQIHDDDTVLHSPSNSFTAPKLPHGEFNKLDLWLIPAEDQQQYFIPDTYDVNHTTGSELLHCMRAKSRITFNPKTVRDDVIAAPDERLIALHTACAKVALMSGAAKHLMEFVRRVNDRPMTEPNEHHKVACALRRFVVEGPAVDSCKDV